MSDDVVGRLAKRPYEVGDPMPAVGSECLVSGANCDVQSDQHRSYLRRKVIGYSDDNEFVCMQTRDCWPTVERLSNCWFAEIPTPRAPALQASNLQVLPCPFCGSPAREAPRWPKHYGCSNEQCGALHASLTAEQWNMRPVTGETPAPLGDTAELIWRAFRALRRDDYAPEYKTQLVNELDEWLKRNTVKTPDFTVNKAPQ